MKLERISNRVMIPVVTIPHLIGKHPQHERSLVSSLEHWQMQQQQTSSGLRTLCNGSTCSECSLFSTKGVVSAASWPSSSFLELFDLAP
jgi:hypothetical protein